MANKAVLGAMAIGLAGYTGMERIKDWQIERERENQVQAQRDHEAEMERRLEEKLRKQGNRSVKDQMSGSKLFQMKVYSHLEDMLLGLAVKVGEEAPLHNRNLQMLNLPLMNNEYEKEDLMLAAAFALGESDVVERVIESFSKQRLGVGLKKFTKRSILNIIHVFQSLEDPDIDHASLNMFVTCGIFHPDLRDEKPRLLLISKDAPSYSDNLRRWGEKFGIHVSGESWLQRMSKVPKRKLRKSDCAKFHFDTTNHVSGDEGLILSNFLCAFDTPYIIDETHDKIGFTFEEIHLPTKRTAALTERNNKRCKPDLDAIAHVFASKIAAGMAREAAKRLSQLLKLRGHCEEGISLEHMSIHSGKGSDLLQHLAIADRNLISGKDKISSALSDALLKLVPLPDEKGLVEGESPQEKLDAEVSSFVDAYLQLVNLSYCEVPLLAGQPPSSFVPKYSVLGEVVRHKDCIWSRKPIMAHSVRRLQTKAERERLALSRELVAPGASFTVLFICSAFVIYFWLCVLATKQGLQYFYPLHPPLCYFVGLLVALWTLHSSCEILGRMFSLPVNSYEWQYYLKVASYCTEFIQRTITTKLGKPTPYDQQVSKLRGQCGSQYRVWKMRIAKRDFHAALKRKRITNKESVLLLTAMADRYYETEEEEVVEGKFQAELNEAEQFLKLQVEEGLSCTEVTLSPDDALKNYLVSDETGKGRTLLSDFCDLGKTVEECVLFAEGDRVLVKFDDSRSDLPGEGEDARRGHRTASVVFSTANRVHVHFDGEPAETPIPVPTHLCSILDENLPRLEDAKTPLLMDTCAEDVSLSDESENETIIADTSDEPTLAPQAQKRARTVEEALIDGGWVLTRAKKHIVYTRRVKLTKDGPSQKQNVTLSKTPSDWRTERKALSLLRRLDDVGRSPGFLMSGDGDGEIVTCSECKEEKPTYDFSKAQLKKRSRMKCKDCVKDCVSESRMMM